MAKLSHEAANDTSMRCGDLVDALAVTPYKLPMGAQKDFVQTCRELRRLHRVGVACRRQ